MLKIYSILYIQVEERGFNASYTWDINECPIIKQFLKVLSLPVLKGNIRIQYFITVKVSDHCFIHRIRASVTRKISKLLYIFKFSFKSCKKEAKNGLKSKSHVHAHRNTPQFRSPHNPLEEWSNSQHSVSFRMVSLWTSL